MTGVEQALDTLFKQTKTSDNDSYKQGKAGQLQHYKDV
jgi:hypothetical protein